MEVTWKRWKKNYNLALLHTLTNDETNSKIIKMAYWLTEGVTYILPKTKETDQKNNYWPITCLPTIYKIITSILEEKIIKFVECKNIS